MIPWYYRSQIRQTTQLAKPKVYSKMQSYLRSHFGILKQKRSNEFKATGNYFSNKDIIEGRCAQDVFGMISKLLYVAGATTKFEFVDIYLGLIKRFGTQSAPQRNLTKSSCQINLPRPSKSWSIEWTTKSMEEPAEQNGIEYLNSHSQVLMDRTGAQDKILSDFWLRITWTCV
jgi:hypothetical protein